MAELDIQHAQVNGEFSLILQSPVEKQFFFFKIGMHLLLNHLLHGRHETK
jgi:hypothetical protein